LSAFDKYNKHFVINDTKYDFHFGRVVVVGKGKLFYFFSVGIERWQKINVLDREVVFFQLAGNVYVYELWRVSARTSLNKNWLWEIRRIFQMRTDQAIAYIRL